MIDAAWKQRIERELTGNILPFWVRHTQDSVHGGFHSALKNDLTIDESEARSAVVTARILWTYSLAYRKYPQPEYLAMARRAYDYIRARFWDQQHEGVYWLVDFRGEPLDPRKHSYAQAFTIYGLAEFFRATGDPDALRLAQREFALLETHAHEDLQRGYIEGCGPDWGAIADPRLSPKEPDCRKSMNTLLHILEAYTGLLPLWNDPQLRMRLQELVEVFLDHVIDPATHHFRLFFHDDWSWEGKTPYSYGHDIEGSWLLTEAAEILGNRALIDRMNA
jgi:cellobiose epimerase